MPNDGGITLTTADGYMSRLNPDVTLYPRHVEPIRHALNTAHDRIRFQDDWLQQPIMFRECQSIIDQELASVPDSDRNTRRRRGQ